MPRIDATYIAGSKTVDDWRGFRTGLVSGAHRAVWQAAIEDYFRPRLMPRYLEPIRVLQENGTFQGEGFSITAIQCTLIEFLESTVQGKSYRYGERLGQHEYSRSIDIFVSFLVNRNPFAREFNEELARDFYVGVRCGLLHEARTKNGWRIWAESTDGRVVDRPSRTAYRNNFQTALLQFIDWYAKTLPSEPLLQEAFV